MKYTAFYYCLVVFLVICILNYYGKNNVYAIVTQSSTIKLTDRALVADVVYNGIKFPTSMSFLKENDILVLEKNNGTVKRIINEKMVDEPLLDSNVATNGERGLLGISVSHSKNNVTYVFLYLTESKNQDGEDSKNGASPLGNRIYRYELSDDGLRLVNPKLLIDLPAGPYSLHNGGKMTIGPDKNLYFIIGDMGNPHSKMTNFKNGDSPDGRSGILRITQDGDKIDDNIQLGKKHPLNKYYAYGIRNGFGLDFDPISGNLWDSELGSAFGDEINLVEKNFNSGWSQVQGLWKPNGSSMGDVSLDPSNLVDFHNTGKYSVPKLTTVDETGFSAIKFLNSNKLGNDYTNTLFVGDFHTGKLYNFKLDDNRNNLLLGNKDTNKTAYKISELEPYVFGQGFGGIVDLEVSPDGNLYVLSIYYGGDNCYEDIEDKTQCFDYSSQTPGTIFKIKLK